MLILTLLFLFVFISDDRTGYFLIHSPILKTSQEKSSPLELQELLPGFCSTYKIKIYILDSRILFSQLTFSVKNFERQDKCKFLKHAYNPMLKKRQENF